jgi:hypothetical protein
MTASRMWQRPPGRLPTAGIGSGQEACLLSGQSDSGLETIQVGSVPWLALRVQLQCSWQLQLTEGVCLGASRCIHR